MPSRSAQERKESHLRYKEDVQRRGKPFYPWAMFHDTVMSLVVVLVIIGLACVWYFTSGPEPADAGLLGPRYTAEADPGTIDFIPRPDWFFFFLFYLLRIFHWPESVILGTVGIPTILMIMLLALPFIDRSRERRVSRRPVAVLGAVLTAISMGVLTYAGATARESVAAEAVAAVDDWQQQQGFGDEEREGAEAFAQVGCLTCHTYLGSGSQNVGAPDLSDYGAQTPRTVQQTAAYILDPTQFGNNVMPPSPGLEAAGLLDNVAAFLHASNGGEGGQ